MFNTNAHFLRLPFYFFAFFPFFERSFDDNEGQLLTICVGYELTNPQ
jgi:hypothetical protein